MYFCAVFLFFLTVSFTVSSPVKQSGKFYPIPPGTDKGLYNKGLHEGDILLVNRTKKSPPIMGKNVIKDADMLWPHAAIVYRTEDSVGCPESQQCELLMKAMDEYHKKSCIRFKEWTGEDDYVSVFFNPDSGSCWSPVGMVGDRQRLSLGQKCWYFGIIVHELGHALGFWHEMNRPDRDQYIVIDWQNIIAGFASAFHVMRPDQVNLLGEKFDYKSVMMYDEYAFSKDGTSPTIQTTDGEVIGPLWMKNSLSDSDVRRIHKLYQCKDNNQKVSFPYNIHCTFKENVCGFKNGEYTIWKWKTDEESNYVITTLDSAGGTPGKFISPNLHPVSKADKLRGPKGCIRFWSILQGNGTMTLSLDMETLDNVTQLSFNDNATKSVWSSDKVRTSWAHQRVTIDITEPFRLTFKSQFYNDVSKDGLIALAAIEILYNGACESISRLIPHKPTNLALESISKVVEDLHNITAVTNIVANEKKAREKSDKRS